MAAAEERQAKALEGIQYHLKELVKVMATMNENMVKVGKILMQGLEENADPAQMRLDDVADPIQDKVAQAEYERSRRAIYEESARGTTCDCSPNYCCCSPADQQSAGG
jgi:hypothetical protein